MARLARSFNKMSDTLNKLNTYKVEMMQQITHELRTPLQTIHAAHYILTESKHGPLTDDQRRLLGTIRENVEKIATFSNQFLDLSRIEAGMMEYRPVRTDLAAMVKTVVDDARISAERKNIVLFFSCEPTRSVMLDTERGTLVFTNLLSNAVKYTGEGGTIYVAVAPSPFGVRVAVKDSGVGIAAEDLPKLFTKFYRASNAVRGKSKGTGLGLALVKAIVEGHGGVVSVESTLGAGSTFTVEFPVAPASAKDA
jgi:signal transduction histidine kinase